MTEIKKRLELHCIESSDLQGQDINVLMCHVKKLSAVTENGFKE